jgi:UDP-N-acetylmuramyl pentapeptide synthase
MKMYTEKQLLQTIILGVVITTAVVLSITIAAIMDFKRGAIKANVAQYNPISGHFEWKTNLTFSKSAVK